MGVPLDKLVSLPRTLRDQAHAQKLRDDAIARRNAVKSASTSTTQHSHVAPTLPASVPKPQKRSMSGKSPLAAKFELLWRAIAPDLPLDKEMRFCERRWRLDYSIRVQAKTGGDESGNHYFAIELEGLGAVGSNSPIGRHQTIKGFQNDAEKYFLAQISGWTVFRLTKKLITTDNIERIAAFIRARK